MSNVIRVCWGHPRFAAVLYICIITCRYVLRSVLWCPLRLPYKSMFGSPSPTPVVCSGLVSCLLLFAHSDIQHVSTIWAMTGVLWEAGTDNPPHWVNPLFLVAVPHTFSFLCCVCCFVCLCSVSVPNVFSVSGLFPSWLPHRFPLAFNHRLIW